MHPSLFDADFQRDFRRLTGLQPAVLDTETGRIGYTPTLTSRSGARKGLRALCPLPTSQASCQRTRGRQDTAGARFGRAEERARATRRRRAVRSLSQKIRIRQRYFQRYFFFFEWSGPRGAGLRTVRSTTLKDGSRRWPGSKRDAPNLKPICMQIAQAGKFSQTS